MALIDFYQLAVLHKLSRDNGSVLSEPSHPLPMPATKFSAFLSSSVRFDPTTRFEPKTPQHKRDATRSAPFSTPISHGTSILPKLRPDTDKTIKYDCAKYEQYIVQDFERHRVFVDIDVFMKHVLRVPEGWRELWGETIGQIKRNKNFAKARVDYTGLCDTRGVEEQKFYKPLVGMTNAILGICTLSDAVAPRTPQRYLRNDPRNVLCGKMKDLRPDIVAVHRTSLSHIYPDERQEKQLHFSNLTWAQPLQVLEVKPWDNALVDGSCMPRLKVNGRDPRDNHARAFTPSRFRKAKEETASPDTPPDGGSKAASAPAPAPPRKRLADKPAESNRKTAKVDPKSTPGGQPPERTERKPARPRTNETEQQKEAYLQVGRYLLEQFSIPAFRSHATVGLVDRDRIQFYHANHSVILVSSAINFSSGEGLDKFIAIVIAFSRLSLRDSGILHNLHGGQLFRDNEKLVISDNPRGSGRMQEGNRLVLGGDEKTEPFTLTYGEAISHEPSLAGRGTAVLDAKSPRWNNVDLVVKIGWPGSERVAENEFLTKAVETAKSSPVDNWALKHLPRVLFAQDVVFDSDSIHESVASIVDGEFVDDGEYTYERRTLRIIVQERLYPLKTLTNVKDIAQVLLDVACVHRWLYLRAGILHRDFSPNNIMYRIVKERDTEAKVYGVLTDFDLASWKKDLNSDYKKTSQQRTGTPPFMAYELLNKSEVLHMYRHDLESLFYIMLILATHYEIRLPTKGEKDGGLRTRQKFKGLPYQDWFDQDSYETLALLKRGFFSSLQHLDLSPAFEDFRPWLGELRLAFRRGIRSKEINEEELTTLQECRDDGSEDEDTPVFDDETLGGHVHYSTLINPVRKLKGKLKGLIIRYDPSLRTSIDPVKTDG